MPDIPRTADRLRHDIDRGRTGDKVDCPDPAAAPLGTDEEAAGTPPSPAEIELASDNELRRGRKQGPAETKAYPSREGAGSGPTAYPAAKARGAQIIMKTPAQRVVFFGGGALVLLLVLLLIVLSGP